MWQDRVPAKYKDIAPRLVADDTGEAWVYEGKRVETTGLAAVAGKSRQEFSPEAITYADMRPGCYDPHERIKDMNIAGILGSLNFPSFPRFCGQKFYEAKDKTLALLCTKAYNDWMIDEWCGAAPDRFIPMIIVPLWDPSLCVEEVERCAAKGNHAVGFSENPERLGLPTINDKDRYWDPLFKACEETDTVVNMHIGSSSQPLRFNKQSSLVMDMAWGTGGRVSGTMLDWLFSPVLDRFPKLQVALSEGGIGWMPYFLETAERVVGKQRYWASRGDFSLDLLTGEAVFDTSGVLDFDNFDVYERFRAHFHGCFFSDRHGLKNAREIGIDNIMIESDYPHSDSSWPDSIKLAHEEFAQTDLTAEEQFKILRGNAEKLYSFAAADPAKIQL